MNFGITDFLRLKKTLAGWFVPLYQGYVKTNHLIFNKRDLYYTVVMRFTQSINNQHNMAEVTTIFENAVDQNIELNRFYLSLGN